MLSYELCKKLKDAGFFRNASEPLECDCGNLVYKTHSVFSKRGNEIVPQPTFSELIRACGDGFEVMIRNNLAHIPKIEFTAISHEGQYKGAGDSPEEAVANLYLALNPIK